MIKCTVAIPVYNREKFIDKAIGSALEQNILGMEILVVDNCSTDGTWKILQKYRDKRLRLVRNDQNIGLFRNFNRCLGLARGRYLRFLCSDDELIKGTLEKEIAVMDAHPDVALLSTRGYRKDELGRVLGIQAGYFKEGIYPGFKAICGILWFQAHYAYNPINYPSGVLIRKNIAAIEGKFDVNMKMAGDVDFFLRILEHGNLAILDTLGCNIMIHPGQESSYLIGDLSPIIELDCLVNRYKEILQKEKMYLRVKEQMAAYSLGLAFKLWRIGFIKCSKAHYDIVRKSGVKKIKVYLAILRMLALRILFKFIGVSFLPASCEEIYPL